VPWLLALWDSVQPEHRGTLRYFDKVITPYHCMADAFSSMKSVKPYVLEWDNTLLGTAKPTIRSGAIKILVPLADSQAERVDMALFDVLDELLLMRKQLRMTVTCGRGWTIQARQRLRTLALNNPSQVSVIRTPTAFQRIQLYANHDLTLWLSQWEGMAMVGIDSIKMGTPVVAWNNAPQSEYLKTGTNAALVPCKLQHNWLGMGEVVPDYAAVKQQVLGVIDDDHFRALLQKSVLKNTECRSQKLQDKWSELWK
jgi:glycosyltransferase involved in cell wall biosynthesis